MDNQEEYKGYTIKVEPDEEPESPCEWDNLGKMICFHKRYELGDKHEYNQDDFDSWEELEKQLKKDGAVVIAPLFLYDHSGLRIKIGSFTGLLPQGHAEFDSGQVGYIVAFQDDIKKEFDVKKITKATIDKTRKILEGEVKAYDQFLAGDVYRFSIKDQNGEQIDSCGGFYGFDYCLEEAKSVVDYLAKEA